jgi:hypothetical protein
VTIRAIIKTEATPLLIAELAHRTTVNADTASTYFPMSERPAGVGMNAIMRPTTIAIPIQIHFLAGLAAVGIAADGGAGGVLTAAPAVVTAFD